MCCKFGSIYDSFPDSFDIHRMSILLAIYQQLTNTQRIVSFYMQYKSSRSCPVNFFSSQMYLRYLSHVMRKPIYAICEQQRHSLISAFVVHCLDSIIPLVSISKISSLYLALWAAKAGLSLPWLINPGDRFSRDEAHFNYLL